MEGRATHQLNVEMAQTNCSPGCFADSRKSLWHQIIE